MNAICMTSSNSSLTDERRTLRVGLMALRSRRAPKAADERYSVLRRRVIGRHARVPRDLHAREKIRATMIKQCCRPLMFCLAPIVLLAPCNGFVSDPKTCKDTLNHLSHASTIADDESEYNPDTVGVFVDGFPLPPTPSRPNDDELAASLRRVPITSLDQPLPARNLGDPSTHPLRVLIAGGGLGGLALASTLTQFGHDVHVFEQATQYKPFGGPIQIQSNALWALNAINPVLYSAIAEVGVRTGDRLSGIKDGKRYEEGWLVKFDAATPAIKCGLPLTLAINRVVLQEIFLKFGVAEERVHTSSRVVAYKNLKDEEGSGVEVTLEDGQRVYGDVLIGADGIWSRVKHQLEGLDPSEAGPAFATKHARYSGYTCFTGTCKHTPDDIDSVAYKVFLGQEQCKWKS